MYNRSIYSHKIFYEALQRLLIKKLLEENCMQLPAIFEQLQSDLSEESYNAITNTTEFETFSEQYVNFVNALKEKGSSLTKFWLSYIDLFGSVLDLIYSTRTGNWALFVGTLKAVSTWAFAHDRYNYSRYLLVFIGDMLELPNSHPEVYRAFEAGGFSVQLSKNNSFGRNESDKTIENTINKDTKTPGGVTGFSTNIAAVNRWVLNAQRRAECFHNFTDLLLYSNSNYKHTDLGPNRIRTDERNVQAVVEVLELSFTNPFDDGGFVGLSTGIQATKEIEEDLLSAFSKGEKAKENFVLERMSETQKNLMTCLQHKQLRVKVGKK